MTTEGGRERRDRAPVVLVTGAMAAGKSTVAEALATRLPVAAHVRGDAFRRMIVSGRAAMTDPLTPEASRQLHLRHRLAATVADGYAAAGVAAVVQDIVLGPDLPRFLGLFPAGPVYCVVLAPDPATLAARDAARPKTGYDGWSPESFDRLVRDATPWLGLWLDTSHQTVGQTVDAILGGWDRARIR